MTGLIGITEDLRRFIPRPLRALPWRAHPLDGKLLLFERATGLNLMLEGPEVAHLRRLAPRTLLIAVTNFCNLTCPFCYRDQASPSLWRYASLLQFCREADEWGVLELAFGGGEPMIFPRWEGLVCELHETTGLCVNFTTNGTLLTEPFLRAIAGRCGQIRLSLYDDNHWADTLRLLVRCRARFGVNWLITPQELPGLAKKFQQLLELGVRDFLLLSYKGADASLHLRPGELARFGEFVAQAYRRLGTAVSLKLDACWGNVLPQVPRLFAETDCGAGDEILSITSDRHIKPCSFHHLAIPFSTLADVRQYWQRARQAREAARILGCARLPGRGRPPIGRTPNAYFDLA